MSADLTQPLLRLSLAVKEIRLAESELEKVLGVRGALANQPALRKILRASMQIQVATKELQPYEFRS